MMATTQQGGGSKGVRSVPQAKSWRSRYRVGGALGHAVNFARGLAIGSIIALLFWLMVG